jgi:alpha-L-fucosidase
LADVVSKNGNLLLNVPVRGDGTIDDKEIKVVEGIAAWMDVNKESIFGTRPWKVFGEGPASGGAALSAQGFNEGKAKPFTAQDVRFTSKGNTLYAIVLGWPTNGVQIQSLGKSAKLLDQPIRKIVLLDGGQKKSRQPVEHLATLLMQHDRSEKLKWTQTDDALVIRQPKNQPGDIAIVFKISLRGS